MGVYNLYISVILPLPIARKALKNEVLLHADNVAKALLATAEVPHRQKALLNLFEISISYEFLDGVQ